MPVSASGTSDLKSNAESRAKTSAANSVSNGSNSSTTRSDRAGDTGKSSGGSQGTDSKGNSGATTGSKTGAGDTSKGPQNASDPSSHGSSVTAAARSALDKAAAKAKGPTQLGTQKDQSRIPTSPLKDQSRLPGLEGRTPATPTKNTALAPNATYTKEALNNLRHNGGMIANPVDNPRPMNGVNDIGNIPGGMHVPVSGPPDRAQMPATETTRGLTVPKEIQDRLPQGEPSPAENTFASLARSPALPAGIAPPSAPVVSPSLPFRNGVAFAPDAPVAPVHPAPIGGIINGLQGFVDRTKANVKVGYDAFTDANKKINAVPGGAKTVMALSKLFSGIGGTGAPLGPGGQGGNPFNVGQQPELGAQPPAQPQIPWWMYATLGIPTGAA